MKTQFTLTLCLVAALCSHCSAGWLDGLVPKSQSPIPQPQPSQPSGDASNDAPQTSMVQTISDAKAYLNDAQTIRELKQSVDSLLRSAAANVHASAMIQNQICDGLKKYLQAQEEVAALELKEEVQYSALEAKLTKATSTNTPISELTTVITADLQGSQVNAKAMIEQLDNYKQKRDSITKQAQPSYELFLKSDASLKVIDNNYKTALVVGDVATEAVGDKLNQLQTKSVAEIAVGTALVGALAYYVIELEKKHDPWLDIANIAAKSLVTKLIQDLKKTQDELRDLKGYAEQARGLLMEIHSHGPLLRDQNGQISSVLAQLTNVARQSLEARAETDKEVEKFLIEQDSSAKNLVTGNRIAVFAK